jgi:hypothetical protein
LDVTIGYPGIPFGAYPQEWYGLLSIFFRSVPPPTVHLHLELHGNLSEGEKVSGIPSLITTSGGEGEGEGEDGIASSQESRSFELWLRSKWEEKEIRMERFSRDQKFYGGSDRSGEERNSEEDEEREVVEIRQV